MTAAEVGVSEDVAAVAAAAAAVAAAANPSYKG